jgi:hypothetical protein
MDMHRARHVFALFGVALACLIPASASGQSGTRVPFDLFENNILVQARINGSQPVWLVLDTGASIDVLNERLFKSLGLLGAGAVHLNAGGGAASGTFAEGATINLQGVEATGQRIAAVPLDEMKTYFGRDVEGLLGNNFLGNFVVEIDYAGRTLTFHDPKTFNLAGDPEAIPLENRGGIPFAKVEVSVSGRDAVTEQFLIDSGSTRTFHLNRPFAEAHQVLQGLPKGKQIEGVGGGGLGGDTRFVDARIDHLRLGRYTIAKPVISVSRDAAGEGASSDAGIIGGELLRRFTVILDYQNQRMSLKPNRYFSEPYDIDMSGLELVAQPDDLKAIRIKSVRAHFPAEQAGLREGDLVVAIDGRPAAEFDLDRLTRMFMRNGKEIRLTVRRGEKVIEAKLRLKRAI